MTVTTGMVGHGFYDENSAPQWSATETVLPWLEDAAASIADAGQSQPIGIADFGCSEGANSIRVIERAVSTLRSHTVAPILTVQSDLPTNDFSNLIKSLRPEEMSVFGEQVYSALVGGSMFGQLLPPRSIHLATTFNAIGFLSRRPVDRLPGYILPNGPSKQNGVGKVVDAERKAFAEQAAHDLETFLRVRAAELVPGGKLLVQVFGASEEARTCDGIYDVLNDAVLEAVADGVIDRAEYATYYQPVYFRTVEDLTAPVVGASAPLSGLFVLDRAMHYETPVSFVEAFRSDHDAGAYAKRYTDFFRAFTEAVLCLAFPSKDPKPFADDIYARAERLVRRHPERYPFRYISVAMLLTRSAASS
ncbi:MAG: hypothetical protein KDA73_07835 [Rhodobacteraceae bacterium]|nr:hypothetical protein [Paracoccaceae bacterium]